jgi:RNA polymerase sigma factor (TIGR02999 family)
VDTNPNNNEDATLLLNAAAGGDKLAADRLLPLVYDQLRKAAQRKLIGPRQIPWANRAHFYAAAAEAMRRILLDHARKHARRGGPARPLTEITDVQALADSDPEHIIALDAALTKLETEDPEAAAIVRLRFFAGLSVEQAAEAMGVSACSAARLWTYARASLYRAMTQRE